MLAPLRWMSFITNLAIAIFTLLIHNECHAAFLLSSKHSCNPLSSLHAAAAAGNNNNNREITAGGGWFPRKILEDDDIFRDKEIVLEIELTSVQLAATLIRKRLETAGTANKRTNGVLGGSSSANGFNDDEDDNNNNNWNKNIVAPLVRGRFMDLACQPAGERVLESLFDDEIAVSAAKEDIDYIRAAVVTLQSLCVMGTQVGVKGQPEQLRRMVSHLQSKNDPALLERDLDVWDFDSVRRLKYRLDRGPALDLLSELLWKRTTQGAFDLLVQLGAWDKHEDIALLRSGFPLRFSEKERTAPLEKRDPDQVLGLRRDLREMKVYTVDSASTSEIDDGLSVEVVQNEDGSKKHRIWIHIADADRWAPRNSVLFETARKRVTSLYLPNGSISMFPDNVSTEIMSLKAGKDAFALSFGVELNPDGSIDSSSVILTPSIVRVSYRLTYDDVDEMLEEGIGYNEEWELGVLLDAATKRRNFRVRNGSVEGVVPNPIPYASVSAFPDKSAIDGVEIAVNVQVSHNAGTNRTVADASQSFDVEPVSSAYLLVTESMILAGEALGHWKARMEAEDEARDSEYANMIRLPFRTQAKPDFKSRSRERKVMMNLLEYNLGGGFCHAWYSRRFLQNVRISETEAPHSGLGLSSYVQWSSPIRRFGDLQVHAMVKRYLRRRRVYEMMENGLVLPPDITAADLGLPDAVIQENGKINGDAFDESDLDKDINFLEGIGLMGAARTLQKQSQQYWLFEYIRRRKTQDPTATYDALVLGCVDPEKRQYAIYLYDFGLEHRYTCPAGRLDYGAKLKLRVDSVSPRNGILSFVQAV